MATENENPIVVLITIIFGIIILGGVSAALLPMLKGTSVYGIASFFAWIYNDIFLKLITR
ncbi:hypothetical protein HNP92_000906 [Methanococcus maripaludis]|uniref:Uncharacterized protein n=1 Tax=Methanococcus maripaludis TaxID=39152 RepID=A0A2L1C9J0_METMI|nr:hypothetical protein [Methanococcus maripaludis]AVB75979.1 hypothetical protein MMJJ_05620 [Methanococcus maripaludis]MBB6401601.1 hypothetical protein [Methanococcus maripaludis]